MRKVLGLSAVMAIATVLIAIPLARGEESVEGKIRAVDETKRVVTLEDGTKLAIPDNVQVDRKGLEPGARVKASYELQEGEKLVTDIQVQRGEGNR
jgi:hypothetical protein